MYIVTPGWLRFRVITDLGLECAGSRQLTRMYGCLGTELGQPLHQGAIYREPRHLNRSREFIGQPTQRAFHLHRLGQVGNPLAIERELRNRGWPVRIIDDHQVDVMDFQGRSVRTGAVVFQQNGGMLKLDGRDGDLRGRRRQHAFHVPITVLAANQVDDRLIANDALDR